MLSFFMTALEEKLSAENARLKEELAILKRALFGPKSERIISSDDQMELGLDIDHMTPKKS